MKKVTALLVLLVATAAFGAPYCVKRMGFLKRTYTQTTAGMFHQVCVYDVLGDEVEVFHPNTQLCPMQKEFCF